jgi:hypothetical protein
MAKVAEGIARVAGGIAIGRRQRSELAAEIKAATRSCRSDVRSFLESVNTSRGRATRDQAAEAKKVAMGRHGEVCSLLKGLKASRGKATRVYQRDAIAINSRRRGEVKALLTQFGREMVARRKHRQELSMAQLEKAAGFMRDLTSGVAALRDRFVKDDRDRAAAIHGRLAAYALDIAARRSRYGAEALAGDNRQALRPPRRAIGRRLNLLRSTPNRLARQVRPPVPLRILLMRRLDRAHLPSAIWVNSARRDVTEDIRNECCRVCKPRRGQR